MARLGALVRDLLATADGRLADASARAASVRTTAVRKHLRRQRRPFLDPESDCSPSEVELDGTARWLIATSSARAGLRAGFAGLAGGFTVPSEASAAAIATLRLAQRLAVVYGLDPETDRGRLATWQALAAGWEVELPDRGTLGLGALELAAPRSVGAALTRGILGAAARRLGRPARLFPVVSAAPAAFSAQRHTQQVGIQMWRVVRALAGFSGEPICIEDAFEVPSAG